MTDLAFRFCDETEFGFSWIADERMTRTSHALAHDGRFWLVDPVDWPGAIDRTAQLGEPAGVLQLLDRHNRDCAEIAERFQVEHFVVPETIAGSPFEVVPVRRTRRWSEVALWWPETSTLVIAEAIGTNTFYTAGADAAGVHLALRLTPPRAQLRAFAPEHVLVGHGEGLHGRDAPDALRRALESSRTGLPRAMLGLAGLVVGVRRGAAPT